MDKRTAKLKQKIERTMLKEIDSLVEFRKKVDAKFAKVEDKEDLRAALIVLMNDKYFNGPLLYTLLSETEYKLQD